MQLLILLALSAQLATPSRAPHAPVSNSTLAVHGGDSPLLYERPEQRIATTFAQYVAATGANRVEAIFPRDFFANQLMIIRSDGRGIQWDAPRLIHTSSSVGLDLFRNSFKIHENESYFIWAESTSNPTSAVEPFFMRSVDESETFSQPLLLDKGSPEGIGSVQLMEMVLTFEGSTPVIHVLMQATDDQPALGGNGDLYIVSSRDGGQTFSSALEVNSTSASTASVRTISLAAQGTQVAVAWADDRNDPGGEADIFFRRSLDGAQSWAEPEQQLTSSPAQLDVPLTSAIPGVFLLLDDQRVIVAWRRNEAGFVYSVRAASSLDGGLTFAPATQVGDYTAGVDSAYLGDAGVDQGRFFLSWSDYRTGMPITYVSHSDDGRDWIDVEAYFPPAFSRPFPRLTATDGVLALLFQETFGIHVSVASLDGGESFTPPTVQGNFGVTRLLPTILYNSTYRNLVTIWSDAPGGGCDELYASGYRPQTVVPKGFAPGSTEISFELARFTDSTSAYVAISNGTGSTFLDDGRVLGLAPSELLSLTAFGRVHLLRTELDASGAGTTPPIHLNLASTSAWTIVALGLDPATGKIASFTDVIQIHP